MRNDSDDWMILIGEEPLAPRSERRYEMMNFYEDYTFDEMAKWPRDPVADELWDILHEEIQKEINAEIIRTICANAKIGGDNR